MSRKHDSTEKSSSTRPRVRKIGPRTGLRAPFFSGDKHKQPIRTCIGCRRERRKREMIRIVHTTQGAIEIDPKGKMAGRGAYLCANAQCWDAALTKGQVERALRTTLSEEDRTRLQAQALTFPRFDARAGE